MQVPPLSRAIKPSTGLSGRQPVAMRTLWFTGSDRLIPLRCAITSFAARLFDLCKPQLLIYEIVSNITRFWQQLNETVRTDMLKPVSGTHDPLFSSVQFSPVQLLSHVRLFATPWMAAHQGSLSITNSRSLPKGMPIELMMPSSHFILYHSLLFRPPIPPSIRVFSNESTLHMKWPKYQSFSFSISPSNEHPGLISFRMDWLDLLAAQGTLKSLLQHHSSKASIFRCSAFFTVQLSHSYMTTGKTIALTRWTFVGKPMSLLFNMLSRSPLLLRFQFWHFPAVWTCQFAHQIWI